MDDEGRFMERELKGQMREMADVIEYLLIWTPRKVDTQLAVRLVERARRVAG